MEDQTSEKTTRIPTLTRENHEAWFRRMTIKLRGKGVYYTIEKDVAAFAWIIDPKTKEKPSGTPPTTTTDSIKALDEIDTASQASDPIQKLTEDFAKWGGSWNIDKKDAYVKHESYALDIILQSLDDDDQALVDEFETAMALWTALKSKYSKTNESTANRYLTKIGQFVYKPSRGIDSSWTKLKGYRRKLVAANPVLKSAYPDGALFMILTKKLPEEFKATTDGFRLRPDLSVEDKLKVLYEVEEDHNSGGDGGDNSDSDSEKGHVARTGRGQTQKYVPPHRRRKESTDSIDSNASRKSTRLPMCYLCNERHYLRDCEKIPLAQKLLRAYEKKLKEKKKAAKLAAEEKREKKKSSTKSKASSKQNKSKKSSSSKKHRAYVADTDPESVSQSSEDLESDVEVSGLSAQELSS